MEICQGFLINELLISPESFLPEPIESSNTVEDIEKARILFQKYKFKKIIIVTSEFHLKRVQYIAEKALPGFKEVLSYSFAPDSALDQDLLKKLYEHENQALIFMQANYHPAWESPI